MGFTNPKPFADNDLMLKITAAAAAHLRGMCRGRPPGNATGQTVVQRLVAGQYGRLQFVDDDTGDHTGDTVLEDADGALLLIETELYEQLDELTLDCETHRGTSLLRFRTPEPPA